MPQVPLQNIEIEKALSQIPPKEREKVSYFFKNAIFWDSFGYVLLGDKPCSITQYQRISWHPRSWIAYFTPHNLKMKRGWEAWRKYEHLFPHPKFCFLEEDSDLTNSHFITLVHIQAFSAQIQIHKNDFQSEIHETNGPILLHQGLIKRFFTEVLKAHDGLIGTVLGYGRDNAWGYCNNLQSMESFTDADEQAKMESYFQSQGAWKFFTGNICRDFSHLFLPGFKVQRDSVETQTLREKYTNSREKLRKIYENNDCLTTTIEVLIQ